MRRREFITLIGGAAAWPFGAIAQQKPAVIGFMGSGAAETSAHLLNALMQGLRENGLAEGKDFVLVARWSEGHYERFSAFARELTDKVRASSLSLRLLGLAPRNKPLPSSP